MPRARPNLRIVPPEPEPERHGDYRDWLKANRRSREWIISETPKRAGDLVVTGQAIVRIGNHDG